jgi:hypothetical protein
MGAAGFGAAGLAGLGAAAGFFGCCGLLAWSAILSSPYLIRCCFSGPHRSPDRFTAANAAAQNPILVTLRFGDSGV